MLRFCRHSGMFVLSFAAALVLSIPDAFAQKRLTYQQAFAKCKADVVASTPGETAGSSQRYTRGMACMKQHGYNLKKSAKF
jgi:hypothetical protein